MNIYVCVTVGQVGIQTWSGYSANFYSIYHLLSIKDKLELESFCQRIKALQLFSKFNEQKLNIFWKNRLY